MANKVAIVTDSTAYIPSQLTAGYNSFIGPIEITLMGSNMNSGPGLFVSLGFEF